MREDIKKRIEQIENSKTTKGYVFDRRYKYPSDWSLQKLGKLTKKLSIKNKKLSACPAYSINNEVGFIPQNEQFEQGSYINLDKASYKVVCRGQFAYNPARINVGSIGLLKDIDQVVVSSLYVCFSLKAGFDIDYFENWFQTYDFYKEIIRNIEGSVREYLFYENFSNINIAMPKTLKEQQKIAEILNQCSKVIDLKKQLIEEECKRKKWLMQNLLDPDSGIRLPGFHEKWKNKNLGKIFIFRKSFSASRSELGDTGICYLHYGDIHSNNSYIIDVQKDFFDLPKLQISNYEKYLLQDGDVVFVDASEDYDGASKYVVVLNEQNINFISGLHTIPARSRSDVLSTNYKRYCFQTYSFKKQIAFYASGMKVFGLNRSNLAKITISYPGHKEQLAITNILSNIDCVIDLLEQELTAWQQKKKALMQLLLTGIVRVTA